MKLVQKTTKARRVDATALRAQAVDVAGAKSFPELAALLLAKRFRKLERRADARTVLLRYLARYPETPAILEALQASA